MSSSSPSYMQVQPYNQGGGSQPSFAQSGWGGNSIAQSGGANPQWGGPNMGKGGQGWGQNTPSSVGGIGGIGNMAGGATPGQTPTATSYGSMTPSPAGGGINNYLNPTGVNNPLMQPFGHGNALNPSNPFGPNAADPLKVFNFNPADPLGVLGTKQNPFNPNDPLGIMGNSSGSTWYDPLGLFGGDDNQQPPPNPFANYTGQYNYMDPSQLANLSTRNW